MVTDYEAAWIALGEVVAAKTQHGREGLLAEMARLAGEHRVAAGDLPRFLRLYGVEVERARSTLAEADRDEAAASQADRAAAHSPADAGLTGHHRPGGHDADSRRRTEDGSGDGRCRAGAAA